MNKRIGIIGSGIVAQALGKGFMKYGYEVMLGTREPLCMLWCIPGILNNEWTHAFKLLK